RRGARPSRPVAPDPRPGRGLACDPPGHGADPRLRGRAARRERIVLLAHPLALPEADLCRAGRPGLKVAAAYLAPSNLPTVHDPLMLGPWAVPRWVPLAARRWLWRSLGERLI